MWISNLCIGLTRNRVVDSIVNHYTSGSRIAMGRNLQVKEAMQLGLSHLLFIDPDMLPDTYLEADPQATPVWDTFWSFMQANPGSVLAAPYCGPPPKEEVHVFSPNPSGDLKRVSREQAAALHGWQQVGGAGTGFMLIDMDVFKALKNPYFHDVYTDETESKLRNSQDVDFSKKCWEAGIPMYVNFDCWCDHQQMVHIRRPGWVDPPPRPAPELIVR
jgi:hypothetical protein